MIKTAIKVATAPVSWGVLEFDEPAYPFQQVLDEMVLAGYTGTELGPYGYLPADPAQLKDELNRRNLKLISAFVPIPFGAASLAEIAQREGAAQKVVELLHALGCQLIVLSDDNLKVPNRAARAGRIRPEDELDAAGWQRFAAYVTIFARQVKERFGLSVAFHHHCGGYVETPAEVARLMQLTPPDAVGLCLDTGHYTYGGGDPVEAVKTYGNRINHLHLKDCNLKVLERIRAEGLGYLEGVSAGVFCELGQGSVDFPSVMKALDVVGYAGHAVVEQDILLGKGKGTPLDSARRNRQYLRVIGL